jgi:predicted nucleic acid-binding protein
VPEVLRVFLDANVLFSAAYRGEHDFLEFWCEPTVVCLTSFYVADEARRNCDSEGHRGRLAVLLERTHLVSDATNFRLPARFTLPSKDQPVLQAALQAGGDYLITGDKHFAMWMDGPIPTRVGTLRILRPRPFLDLLAGKH